LNNLTTKNFFTTYSLYQRIQEQTLQKTGVNQYIQFYKYLYIIHKIIADKTFHKGDYVGCKMNIDILTALFGGKDQSTSRIIKDLVSWGFITKSENYTFKKSSSRYVLSSEYSNGGILILSVDITDAGFVKKLIDYDKIEINKTVKQLAINISNLSLTPSCYSYINNKYNLSISHTIERVVDQETVFKVSKTLILDDKSPVFLLGGVPIDMVDLPLIQIHLKDFNSSRPDEKSRIYNNLTNLKREYRQYISFNGKPLMMTDISNSQVLLSVAAVKNQYSITSGRGLKNLPADIKKYQDLAESGKFYEYIMGKAGYTGDRNKFKKQFFTDVFFSKVTEAWSTAIKDVFMQEFPTVYKIINELKSKDYRNFAISMQRLEASIMIDTVAKKMIKAGKCILTLHDAIVTDNDDDLIMAEQLISDAMVKYDINPKFKRETAEKYIEKTEPIMEKNEMVIDHYIESFTVSNYNDLEPVTASLTDQQVEILMEQFAIASIGHRDVFVDSMQFNIYIKYDDDDQKIINFKNFRKAA